MIRLSIRSISVLLVMAASLAVVQSTKAEKGVATGNYRSNVRRSGYTAEPLLPPYHLLWTHTPRHAPRPAWHEPAWETQRIDHDYAYAVSAGDELVYFGSSADHAVHALEISTGQERWVFFTEGPVRFAPAIARGGRIYATSDDGYLYCLNGARGTLIWKYRPTVLPDERLVGNEQIMACWPSRCSPLVHNGRVYATFGIWSPEGIFVSCLDAASGTLIWQNDSSSTQAMCMPHHQGLGGTSPCGYLALCGKTLVVPNGRAAPAYFDADTGRFIYHEAEGLFPGGSWTMTHNDLAFVPCETLKKPNPETHQAGPEAQLYADASIVAIEAQTGKEVFHLQGGLRGTIADNGELSLFGPDSLLQVRLDKVRAAAKKETVFGTSRGRLVQADKHVQWKIEAPRIYTLIRAGNTLIAGGQGSLLCYDTATGKQTWKASLDGQVRDLLVYKGRLFVSTTTGDIHCFAPGVLTPGNSGEAPKHITAPPAKQITTTESDAEIAKMLAATGVSEGYALVLGKTETAVLASLAQQSKLTIIHAQSNSNLDAVRNELSAAGFYGTRIAVHHVAPGPLPYAEYFANLIWVRFGDSMPPIADLYRVLRPCGGVALISLPDAMRAQVQAWLAKAHVPASEIQSIPGALKIVRGPLPGAGSWTHQYANAGKSCASDEQLARLPLRVLWFGGVGPEKIVSRHFREPAPLAINGRMFVVGLDDLMAMDAYNGRILWERELPGVGHWPADFRGGSAAVDEESVYALQGKTCLRLDAATGQTRFTYQPPASKGTEELPWEYLAVMDDTVIGALGNANIERDWWSRAYPDNRCLFALDKKSGDVRWGYTAKEVIDSNGIACDGQRVYVIDGRPHYPQFKKPTTLPRTLKALDLHSGKEMWHATVGPLENSLWLHDGVLLATCNSDGLAPMHKYKVEEAGGNIEAFAAADGARLWQIEAPVQFSPVLVNKTLYLPQAAYDIHTGKLKTAINPFTDEQIPGGFILNGGCSKYAGCPNLITGRSASLGFYDLARGGGQYWYPNVRASCWINMIPACGLVLVPEGSSSCPCAYDYKTSLAFAPVAARQNDWCIYPRFTKNKKPSKEPLQRMWINCGAPADRVDNQGNFWLSYPRPLATGPIGGGGMGKLMPYEPGILPEQLDGSVRRFIHNPDFTPISGTDKPWLYSCGLVGPLHMEIPVASAKTKSLARNFRVTLMFCELEAPPQPRIFDVLLQGKPVLSHFNVLAEAKVGTPLTKEFTVSASDTLTIELRGQNGTEPLINGIILRAEP